MKDVVAIVLAAGLGTRMKSSRQKALHRLAGRPLVAYPVRACLEAGCSRVVIVVGHQAELVKAEITKRFEGAPITFALQEEQMGTAHATLCARAEVASASHCLVINGDLPLLEPATLKGLYETFIASGGIFALCSTVLEDPSGYGRVVRDSNGLALRIVEEQDATPEERLIKEVNVGVYAAEVSYLFETLEAVENKNAKGEFYFTDIVALTRSKGHVVGVYVIRDQEQARQVNDRWDLAKVEGAIYRRKARELMLSGVTIHEPETVMIDADCEIGPDTEIFPSVEIRGPSRIGSSCTIGRGCVLDHVTIGDGVEVRPYCVITDSKIEDDARVGPFAHLRPGSVVGRSAQVGNFVEMKKTVLGAGSKANHLTYLGDCTVGVDVNIGAGTITCNYDGRTKHPTVIEDGAFIGSDVQLVAPVKVGKGAYVGAGTTVTKDVPPDALALSRVPQTNILEYSSRKKRS